MARAQRRAALDKHRKRTSRRFDRRLHSGIINAGYARTEARTRQSALFQTQSAPLRVVSAAARRLRQAPATHESTRARSGVPPLISTAYFPAKGPSATRPTPRVNLYGDGAPAPVEWEDRASFLVRGEAPTCAHLLHICAHRETRDNHPAKRPLG